MHAINKVLLFICVIILGHNVAMSAGTVDYSNVKRYNYVYLEPHKELFEQPQLVQHYFFNACQNGQFGLCNLRCEYKEDEQCLYMAVITNNSWIGIAMEYPKQRIYLDTCLDLVDENRFFVVKQLLDILLGDYTYLKFDTQ